MKKGQTEGNTMQGYIGTDQDMRDYFVVDNPHGGDVHSTTDAGRTSFREVTRAGFELFKRVHKITLTDKRERFVVELETGAGYFAPISKPIPIERAALVALRAYQRNGQNRVVRMVNSTTGDITDRIEVSI